jgi:hypothetical protein
MPESCHSCGTALLERGVFCSVCGTPAEPGVGPTKGDNYSAAGPGTLEADGRIVFRLGLAAATFGMLLIGIVVMLADRSSPPDGRPAVISPISKNGAKPSPAPPADFTSEEHEPSWSTATPATHAFVESSPPPKRNNAASQASAVPAQIKPGEGWIDHDPRLPLVLRRGLPIVSLNSSLRRAIAFGFA